MAFFVSTVMKKKTAVVIIQLGTPDSPAVKDVRRYLSEFLNDPRVIDLPGYKRKPLVNGIIVPFRAPKSAKIYQELWDMSNGKSPLLVLSENVVKTLQENLGSEADVHLAMRYGNPSMDDVFEKLRKANYERIVIFPMYPQYASASTGSTIEKAFKLISKWWVIPEVVMAGQFYNDEGYIDCFVNNAKQFDLKSYDHIMFSYHGLPERQVDKVYDEGLCTDRDCENEITEENALCYKATCYATTRALATKLGLKEEEYTVCFQSRLDDKWIKPYSDKVLEDLGKAGKKRVLAFSPAFVADCLETLIEIGVEYQEDFEKVGGEKVDLVPSLNDNKDWTDYLTEKIKTYL